MTALTETSIRVEDLFLDFEQELADILGRQERPRGLSSSSSSSSSVDLNNSRRNSVPYESDGTVPCSAINYAVLCHLSGRSSLGQLKTLSMSVSVRTNSDNLTLLSTYTPNLTNLILDNSRFPSLRVLGEELASLKSLSIKDCEVNNLDGISYAPNLVSFSASDNDITQLLPLTDLRHIETIDLENNLIRDFDAISFLFLCSKLDSLTLRGNPIEEDPEYRDIVKRYLPGLRLLDPKSSSSVQRVAKGTCRTKTRDEGDRDTDDEHDGKDSLVVKKDNGGGKDMDVVEEVVPCGHNSNVKSAAKSDILIQKLMKQSDNQNAEINPEDREKKAMEKFAQYTNYKEEDEQQQQCNKDEEEPSEGCYTAVSPPISIGNSNKLLSRRKSQDPSKIWTSEQVQRPGSASSLGSTSEATTTTLTTSDSGIDTKKTLPTLEPLRKTDKEVVTKRGKHLSMATENVDITGVKRQEGDLEIEDFEEEI